MNLLQRIFSDRYVNIGAINGNMLLYAMYRFAYPFAHFFNRLGLTPDMITTASILSAVLAFLALALGAAYVWFVLFWILTILLDFCDGTVARMSGRIATRAFRFDHMSDMGKISLLMLGTGIRLNEAPVWVLVLIFVFSYLYSEVINHDLKHLSHRTAAAPTEEVAPAGDAGAPAARRLRERIPLVGVIADRATWLYALLQQAYIAVTTFNGHTLLVFLLVPFGGIVTYVALTYLIILSLRDVARGVRTLWHMQR